MPRKAPWEPKKLRRVKGKFYPVTLIHDGYESFTHVDVETKNTFYLRDQWLHQQGVPAYPLTRVQARRLATALISALEDTKS